MLFNQGAHVTMLLFSEALKKISEQINQIQNEIVRNKVEKKKKNGNFGLKSILFFIDL